MKGEILKLHGKLTFLFRKRDVRSKADKQAIASMVVHLYHTHCVMIDFSEEDVEEIIKMATGAYIALNMDDSSDPDLRVYQYSEKEFKQIREVVDKLSELEKEEVY